MVSFLCPSMTISFFFFPSGKTILMVRSILRVKKRRKKRREKREKRERKEKKERERRKEGLTNQSTTKTNKTNNHKLLLVEFASSRQISEGKKR